MNLGELPILSRFLFQSQPIENWPVEGFDPSNSEIASLGIVNFSIPRSQLNSGKYLGSLQNPLSPKTKKIAV